jgi:hypothetical protein
MWFPRYPFFEFKASPQGYVPVGTFRPAIASAAAGEIGGAFEAKILASICKSIA